MSSAAASSSIVKWVNCQSAAILKDLYCIRLLFKTAEITGKVLEKQSHITQFLCIRGSYYLIPKGQNHSHYNYQKDKIKISK